MNVSPDVVIMTKTELQAKEQAAYTRGVDRGRFEAASEGTVKPSVTTPWLNREAAAAYLGMHPEALDKFVRRGEIGSSSHGRIRRFHVADDLDAWLKRGRSGPGTP